MTSWQSGVPEDPAETEEWERLKRGTTPETPVDVSWVTLDEIPAPIVWPWWLAVPAAALRRWLR